VNTDSRTPTDGGRTGAPVKSTSQASGTVAPAIEDWFGDPAAVVERTAAKDEALSHPAATDEDQGCPRYAYGIDPELTPQSHWIKHRPATLSPRRQLFIVSVARCARSATGQSCSPLREQDQETRPDGHNHVDSGTCPNTVILKSRRLPSQPSTPRPKRRTNHGLGKAPGA